MKIFEYSDYKKCINDLVARMPRKGRGQYSKMAGYLGINSVVVSQIFRGNRDLSLEQAFLLAKFFGFQKLEKEYFMVLVQKAKASQHELKSYFDEKLKEIKKQSQDLKTVVVMNKELDDEAKYQFYSQWYYSAIRLSTLLPSNDNVESIAENLELPLARVKEVVDFLLQHELIIQKNNKLKIGPQKTHIGADSPFVVRHHTNWRLQGLQNMEDLKDTEMFYTGPMVLSYNMLAELKQKIVDLITEMNTKIKDAKDETLACLNIDLFEMD